MSVRSFRALFILLLAILFTPVAARAACASSVGLSVAPPNVNTGRALATITYAAPNDVNRLILYVDNVKVAENLNPDSTGTWTYNLNLACKSNPVVKVQATSGSSCPVIQDIENVSMDPTPSGSISATGPDVSGRVELTIDYNMPYAGNAFYNDKYVVFTVRDANNNAMNFRDLSAPFSPSTDELNFYSLPVTGQITRAISVDCYPTGSYTLRAEIRGCGTHVATAGISVNTDPVVSIAPVKLSATSYRADIPYHFPNTLSVDSSRHLKLTAVDASGTKVFEQQIDPPRTGTWSPVLDTSCWADGNATLTVRAWTCGDPAVVATATINVEKVADVSVDLERLKTGVIEAKISWNFPGTSSSSQRHILVKVLPNQWFSALTVADFNAATVSGSTIRTITPQHDTYRIEVEAWGGSSICSKSDADFASLKCDCGKTVGDPIDVTTGNMRFSDHDALPSAGVLPLARTYDSMQDVEGRFGRGWMSIFDAALTAANGRVVIESENDDSFIFWERSTGMFTQEWPREAQLGVLKRNPAGQYEHRRAGMQNVRVYGANGRLAEIRDLSNGRSVQFSWDAAGLPTQVSDSWGAWTWIVSANPSSRRIESIALAGDPSAVWTYQYSGAELTGVLVGSNSWRTYEYSSAGMTVARDALGNIIESHDYDSFGRAITSHGPSGEIALVEYDLPAGDADTVVTRVTSAAGGVTEHHLVLGGGGLRHSKVVGGCTGCGTAEGVFVHDAFGRVTRRQNADGYVTEHIFTANRLTMTTTAQRPAGCDPKTDPSHCILTSVQLAEAELEPTPATHTAIFEYADPQWPERVTTTRTASVRNPGQQVVETVAFDALTGSVVSRTMSGWTGWPPAAAMTRQQTTTLYDGVEGAVFAPGGAFDPAWLTLPQPRLTKSSDGPRTDVTDVSEYVYYPIDNAVPSPMRGRLAASRNAAGHVIRYEDYDLFGMVTRTVDANGVIHESETDALGRSVSSTVKGVPGCDTAADPLCATDVTSTRAYFGAGAVQSETRAGGGVTAYTYDARGRIATISRGPSASDLHERIEYSYDADSGRKSLERMLANENGSWIEKRRESFVYDDEGRLAETVHGDETSIAYTYDVSGRVATIRDENHTTPNTVNAYDEAGRLATITQTLSTAPGGSIETSYGYDHRGNLVLVVDPNGNQTAYVFDDFGRMVSQSSPVSGTTTYAYDAAGNLISTSDANGATTDRTYDALGRLVSATATHGAATEEVSWTYDSGAFGLGRPAVMIDPAGSTEYVFDRRGLLLEERKTIDESGYITSFHYDEDGNRVKIGYPSGREVFYTFDFAGRPLSAVSGAITFVSSAKYLPFGPQTELVFGNGTVQQIDYDARYRVDRNRLTNGTSTIADYDYGYDAGGNITAIADLTDSGYDRAFVYDDLDRLVTANSGTKLWGAGSYAYDAMGNMASLALGASRNASFSYLGDTPKLSSVIENGASRSVTYDAAGNEIQAGTTTSSMTPRNYVASAGALSYRYDGQGIRSVTTYPSDSIIALSVTPATLYPNQSATGTVTLANPAAGAVTVSLQSSSARVSVPESVIIPDGGTTAVFGLNSASTVTPETVVIQARHGLTRTADVTLVNGPALASIAIDPAVVAAGHSADAMISIASAAPAGGARVLLTSSSVDATVPESVVIAEGTTSTEFEITTNSIVTTTQAVTISGTYGNEVSATFSIEPTLVSSLALAPSTVVGGHDVTATVELSNPAPAGGSIVSLSSSDPVLVTVPPTITISAGATSAPFTITTAAVAANTDRTVTATLGVSSATATLTLTPCVPAIAPPPALPSGDTVWIDDAAPAGAATYNGVVWDPSQKASGTQSFTRPPSAEGVLAFSNAAIPLAIAPGETMVLYVLLNECTVPAKIGAQYVDTNGLQHNVSWGGTMPNYLYAGPLPAAGAWTRLEITANALGLENRSIQSMFLYVYGGQAWFDRIGKEPAACTPATAAAPAIPSEDTVWIDDSAPTGATTYSGVFWDPSQKASGSQSFTRPASAGENVLLFSNSTEPLSIGPGESMVFYILLNECTTTTQLGAQFVDTAGAQHNVSWGGTLPNYLYAGALPSTGTWTRLEVTANSLGLENKSIDSIAFYVYGGQAWFDHVGKEPAACAPAAAAPPTIPSGDTVWIDDAAPAGATTYSGVFWDPSQKAGGTLSFTRPAGAGENVLLFSNSTDPLPIAPGESLVMYVLLNECVTPTRVHLQFEDTDGGSHNAVWGAPVNGLYYGGALPAAGTWARLEVTANAIGLENRSIRGVAIYVYDGQAWIDHVGKEPASCTPSIAPPPSLPSGDTVWIDDAAPAGSSTWNGVFWDTTQKASGTQSFTRPAGSGEQVLAFQNASDPLAVAPGEALVAYVLLNECAAPERVHLQFEDTNGGSHNAVWGSPVNGLYYAGALPAAGSWTRLEVPANAIGLENKSIRGVAIYVYDGQGWFDRIGKAPAGSGLLSTIASRLKNLFAPERDATISLTIGARFVDPDSTSALERHSLYSPDLQLLSESEVSTAASKAIESDYIWFGSRPVAQVASNSVHWTFADHLAAPVLQTDVSANVVWRVEREPYGNAITTRTGAGVRQPLGFPGQEYEAGEESAYNVFRWYRSGWARYTQSDPIGVFGGLHLYSYADSRPGSRTDPFGLFSWSWGPKHHLTPDPQGDCAKQGVKAATKVACTVLKNLAMDCKCHCVGNGMDVPELTLSVEVYMAISNQIKPGQAKDSAIKTSDDAVQHEVTKHLGVAAAAVAAWAKKVEQPMAESKCHELCGDKLQLLKDAAKLFGPAWNASGVNND